MLPDGESVENINSKQPPLQQLAEYFLSRCTYNQEIAAQGLMIAAAVDKINPVKRM